MLDLTDKLRPRLLATRLPGLDLPSEAIHPAYGGLSILNIPSSLCRWLGAPELPHSPLDLPELDDLTEGVKQIVLTLIDAVSFDRFRRWIERAGPGPRALLDQGLLAVLTSVAPATTSAALTTLWTGHSPAEHGIVGYELFLREYGLVANMITHSPAAFDGQGGLLYRAGFRPESALPVPTLGPRLADGGVEVHAFLADRIRHSGLSRMHYALVETHGFSSVADLWVSVRELADRPIQGRRLIWAYFGPVDGLSHRFGPDSERAEAEFAAFLRALVEHFVDGLTPGARRDTLLIVVADHGQISTPKDPHYEVRNHPMLVRHLHMLPTGENRLAYLHLRPGAREAVVEYIQRTWPGAFTTLPSSRALQAGLFGPGNASPATPSRLGDLVVLSRGSAYLWWSFKENTLLGRHGGLSQEEMLVPLMAVRLG